MAIKTEVQYQIALVMPEKQSFPMSANVKFQVKQFQERLFGDQEYAQMVAKSFVVRLNQQGFQVDAYEAVPVAVQYRYTPFSQRFWSALKAQFQPGTMNRVGVTVLVLGAVLSALAVSVAAVSGVALGNGNNPAWVTVPVAMFILGLVGVLGGAQHGMEPASQERLDVATA